MESNEASELQEHAEHGAHDSAMRPAAFTMAVLAALVAIVTVLGHRTHTEAVLKQARASLEQDKATDQWGEYQAKKIRSYNTGLESDLLGVIAIADKDKAAKIAKAYADHQAKWNDDLKEAEKAAHEEEQKVEDLGKEVDAAEARANRFDLGEALLEIGLVITSVTLLTRIRMYWYFGIVFGLAGVVSAVAAFLVK